MAQTADAITFEDCKVEFSANGSSWTDVSGFASTVTISGGVRQTGEQYTFDGEFAIVRRGKAEPFEISVDAVYTEAGSDAYAMAKAAYEGGSDLYIRWSPLGGSVGNKQFTSTVGIVTDPPYPTGEAGGGDPVLFTTKLKCTQINETTIT